MIGANLAFSDEPATYDEPKDDQERQLKITAMGEKYQTMVLAYMMVGQNQEDAMSAVMSRIATERAWAGGMTPVCPPLFLPEYRHRL